jgi:hypothetical protein
MSVTVSRNFGRLADIPLTGKALMQEVGVMARQRIISRTLGGVDVHGLPFQSLSPAYAALKAKAGVQAGILQLSGKMLEDITIVVPTDTQVVLDVGR